MYGKWFLSVAGVVLVVLFIIGMIATAYAPIFAVAIAAVVGIFLFAGMASRRSSQVGSEGAAAAQERREAGQGARPSATASPSGGEGDAGQAHRAAVTGGGSAGAA